MGCWISREKLPPHIRTYHMAPVTNQTLAGNFTANEEVKLHGVLLTEFRQPLQVQSHLEMPRILVQLGHTQRTWKLAPQTDPKWSPTWSLTRFQPIYPLSSRDRRYACQVSRAHRTHSRL